MLVKFTHGPDGVISARQTGGDMGPQEGTTVVETDDMSPELRLKALGRFDELAEQCRIEDGALVEV